MNSLPVITDASDIAAVATRIVNNMKREEDPQNLDDGREVELDAVAEHKDVDDGLDLFDGNDSKLTEWDEEVDSGARGRGDRWEDDGQGGQDGSRVTAFPPNISLLLMMIVVRSLPCRLLLICLRFFLSFSD